MTRLPDWDAPPIPKEENNNSKEHWYADWGLSSVESDEDKSISFRMTEETLTICIYRKDNEYGDTSEEIELNHKEALSLLSKFQKQKLYVLTI